MDHGGVERWRGGTLGVDAVLETRLELDQTV